MKNKKTIALGSIITLIFVGLIAFFALGLGKDPRVLDSVREGARLTTGNSDNAIDTQPFALPSLYGDKIITVEQLPKGYFLLNAWGSWCPACHQEHPYLLTLSKTIPIIGLNWPADNPHEREDAKRFLAEAGNPYQQIMVDDKGTLIIDLGVYGAPETFLIAPDRTILHRYAGAMTPTIWETQFLPLIK